MSRADPFATVFIDTGEAGTWREVMPYLVNCRVSNFDHENLTNTGGNRNNVPRSEASDA